MYPLLPLDRRTCNVTCVGFEKLLSPLHLRMRMFTMDSLCKGMNGIDSQTHTHHMQQSSHRQLFSSKIQLLSLSSSRQSILELGNWKRTYTNELSLFCKSLVFIPDFYEEKQEILFVLLTHQEFSPNLIGARVNKGRLNME